MTNVNATYADRLRLCYDLRTNLAKNPEVQALRERLRSAPQSTGPNVYPLPYNLLLGARGFMLAVPNAPHPYYRPLHAQRMQHDVPPLRQAEDEILRSIHAYIMDPKRDMQPAGEPYTALQRTQLKGIATGAWHVITSPFRTLHAWATHHDDPKNPTHPKSARKFTLPWFEG